MIIRVVLPAHLRALAGVAGELKLEVDGAATARSVLEALEMRYPMLRGTIRDQATHKRRPFVRFFACEQDLSHESPDALLPDAVAAGYTGPIVQRIEAEGFQIRAMRLVRLTRADAEGFYAVHRERPFFGPLAAFMSSGPAVVLALEAPDAIRKWRDTMGPTDPSKAAPGTLRRDFGESIGRNATHGSDAAETAAFELGYFFRGMELI